MHGLGVRPDDVFTGQNLRFTGHYICSVTGCYLQTNVTFNYSFSITIRYNSKLLCCKKATFENFAGIPQDYNYRTSKITTPI